jgi:hypothetical protein
LAQDAFPFILVCWAFNGELNKKKLTFKLGTISLGDLGSLRSVAFYLFAYHLVFSGIITYNEYVGNFPAIPFFTAIFFGIPFLLFTTVYLARASVNLRSPRFFWRNALFAFCTCYIVGVIAYNHYFRQLEFSVLSFNAIIMMWYFISFFIGSELKISYGPKGSRIILGLYIMLVLNVFLNYNLGDERIQMDYDHLGIFLFMGDSFALWSLFTIAQYRTRYLSVFIAFTSIVCLYLISSRSSLYGFMFVLPFIFRNTKHVMIRVTFIVLAALMLVFFLLNAEALMSSRMLKFLFTGEDHSFYLREVIMERNMGDILNNWFWGDYAGQLRHGVFGFYIHNYLSLWRQFGLIPFLIFLALLAPFSVWFVKWLRGKKYQEYDFLFYMVLFLLVEIIFTRAYKSHYIWIGLGIMTNIMNEEYKKRKQQKETNKKLVE